MMGLIWHFRLPSWPPDNTFVENPRLIPIPNKNDLLPTTSKDILPTQHLTIDPNTGQMIDTTNILPVQQLIVPSTPGKLDCLLIGDFISQQLVAAVSEALRALSISHTTHLWSAPYETNINSMANCVEASNAVVIFLTDKFQKSQKGQLTLKYSLALNKPILFILEQPSIKVRANLDRDIPFCCNF